MQFECYMNCGVRITYDDAVDILCKHNGQFQVEASVSCIVSPSLNSLHQFVFFDLFVTALFNS